MGFKINSKKNLITVTFSKIYVKGDIINSFIYITENFSLKNIKHIIFDYSNIEDFPMPKNYIKTLKTLTKFSISWNKNMTLLSVAQNENIRSMVNGIIEYSGDKGLLWKYLLFDNLKDAHLWCTNHK